MLPSLYVSHGSPALILMNNSSTDFLKNLSLKFDTPKYILVVSAHWESANLRILYEEKPSTIHDFYGFPKELYDLKYEAPSSLEKNDEVVNLLESNGIKIEKDLQRNGYDHGVWSVLKLIYPKADIPVIQLSLPRNYDAKELLKLGEVLSSLRDDTLILTSGSLTHNLGGLSWDDNDTSVKPYAKGFRDWLMSKIQTGDVDALSNYKQEALYLRENHPTLEHFLPFFVSLGASKSKIGESLNDVFMYSNLSMDTIIFND